MTSPRADVIDGCPCECHDICSCDLGLSLARWRCHRHERHCEACAPAVK